MWQVGKGMLIHPKIILKKGEEKERQKIYQIKKEKKHGEIGDNMEIYFVSPRVYFRCEDLVYALDYLDLYSSTTVVELCINHQKSDRLQRHFSNLYKYFKPGKESKFQYSIHDPIYIESVVKGEIKWVSKKHNF